MPENNWGGGGSEKNHGILSHAGDFPAKIRRKHLLNTNLEQRIRSQVGVCCSYYCYYYFVMKR
jgi:hypothetical protein